MTSQQKSEIPQAWRDRTKEGFEGLDRYDGTVTKAWWTVGGQFKNIQLTLLNQVNQVWEPPEAQEMVGKTHRVFLSGGAQGTWQGVEPVYDAEGNQLGFKKLWTPAADKIVTSSKMWMLVERLIEIVDSTHPLYQQVFSHPVEDAEAWLNMRAVWQSQVVQYKGLDDSTVELPVQILPMMGMVTPASPNGTVNQAAAPTPVAAAPAPVQAQAPSPVGAPPPIQASQPTGRTAESWAIAQSWFPYVASVCVDKSVVSAASECFRDGNINSQKLVTDAIQDGLIDWLVQQGLLVDVSGKYQRGPNANW